MASRFFSNSRRFFTHRAAITSLFASSILISAPTYNDSFQWGEENNKPLVTDIKENTSRDKLLDKLNNSLLNEFNNYIPDVIESVLPGVVNISYGAKGYLYAGAYTGSGFIISDKGFIVTNAHVVSHCSTGVVTVTYFNGMKVKAKVFAIDPISDIAVLKIEDKYLSEFPISNKFKTDNDDSLGIIDRNQSFLFRSSGESSSSTSLTSLKLGSSSQLRQGQFVIAIGSPLYLKNSSSLGIVSSALRDSSDLYMNVKAKHRTSYIQTDAAINTGNSGGPLININGEVIGINTMKAKDTDGISFAISIDFAKEILKQLLKNGSVIRPYIGLKLSHIYMADSSNAVITEKSNLGNDSNQIIVMEVVKNSPAYKAGFEKNDIILEINNEKINDIKILLNSIGLEVGKEFEFKISRNNTIKTLRLITVPENR